MEVNELLIGSRAILHHFPDFPRTPQDWDMVVEPGCESNYELDGEVFELYNIPPLYKRRNLERESLDGIGIATPEELLTLKVSHLFWDIKWEKTMWDVVWLKKKGLEIDMDLFRELYDFWCGEKGTPKRSDLTVTKDQFFDNALMGGLDHDYLHTLINPVPTYTKILIDPNGVEVSEDKYNLLSHEEKLELVREECYVMAYERLANRHYKTAYEWMVKQMILVHAPFYEALFIINNYDELRKPLYNFKEKLDYELSRN